MNTTCRSNIPTNLRTGAKPVAALAAIAVSALALVGRAQAACNLIPSDPDRFQSVIGATNRPFAGPGDTVEIAVLGAGCDARSAGATNRDSSAYLATYVFAPKADAAADIVVVADDCGASAAAIEACRDKPGVGRIECRSAKGPGRAQGIEVLERKDVPVFSLRFPDTDALVGADHDGLTLTGPVRIALTAAGDPLPCALASSSCASLPNEEKLVACVDEMHPSDGTCSLEVGTRHGAFPVFVALPAMNPVSVPPSSPTDAAFAGRDVLATRDASGSLLIPIDWRGGAGTVVEKREAGLRGQRAVEVLRARLGANPSLRSANVGVFTAWGRPLPAVYDPKDEAALLSLFDQLEVPLTVLRVSPRVCAGGKMDGRSCASEADCGGTVCGAAAFELPGSSQPSIGPAILSAVATGAAPTAAGDETFGSASPDAAAASGLVTPGSGGDVLVAAMESGESRHQP